MHTPKVSRDYEVEIDFTVDFKQFGDEAMLRFTPANDILESEKRVAS